MSKRLDLAEVKAHAWMKGGIYEQAELAEAMRDRLELHTKIRNREMQEKMGKHKWDHKYGMLQLMPPQMEMLVFEKAMQADALYSRYMAECADINNRLEKQKLIQAESKFSGPPESLSDDQVNSGSASEDSFKEGEEGSGKPVQAEVKVAARRAEDE